MNYFWDDDNYDDLPCCEDMFDPSFHDDFWDDDDLFDEWDDDDPLGIFRDVTPQNRDTLLDKYFGTRSSQTQDKEVGGLLTEFYKNLIGEKEPEEINEPLSLKNVPEQDFKIPPLFSEAGEKALAYGKRKKGKKSKKKKGSKSKKVRKYSRVEN